MLKYDVTLLPHNNKKVVKMNIINTIRKIITNSLLVATLSGCATQELKPFGKIAAYYDTRGKPTATLIAGASELPLGTKFFGFADVATEKNNLDNMTRPYAELRLSKKSDVGIGVAAEYNRDFSKPRGTERIGLMYEPDLKKFLPNTFVGVKFYPASTNNHGMQAGIYGNSTLFDGEITLDGFFDYNFKPKKMVTELQAGKRIQGNLYGVVEGGYNGFQEKDTVGIGIGLEWKF